MRSANLWYKELLVLLPYYLLEIQIQRNLSEHLYNFELTKTTINLLLDLSRIVIYILVDNEVLEMRP